MSFIISKDQKKLTFNSEIEGLKVNGKEYLSGRDGVLIYNQTASLKSDEVELQMPANTSTLIPALKILSLPYHPYFDQRDVLESQNNITFYWNKSKLAAFYNQFSTDELDYNQREPVIKEAVEFLTKNTTQLSLKNEFLARVLEPCTLIGFYQGFPIYDSSTGFAKLQSRLGIHIDPDAIMISTPLDRYEKDIYELAATISKETALEHSKKKNRVTFPKKNTLLKLLGVSTLRVE